MDEKGFTILELLVAVVITLVVTAAGYTLFNNSFNFSVLHSRTAEMQRESRMAIDIMSREIRNAGYGVIEPFSGTVQGAAAPIQVANNVDPDPSGTPNQLDRITIIEGYDTIGTINATTTPGTNTLTIKASAGIDPTNPSIVGNTITIEGFYYGTVTAVAGGGGGVYTLTLGTLLDQHPYSTLNSVMLVRTITYHVGVPSAGAEPVLYRDDPNGVNQVVASGIEDLQFAYLLNDGTETNAPAAVAPPAAPTIRAVRISVLARVADPKSSATKISTRPAIEDHAGAATADRYHRLLITKVVEVRSLGLL